MNLPQFITLRFLTYLLYNAYVLHCLMYVEDVLDSRRQGDGSDGCVLTTFHRMWNKLSLRGFVANINATIINEGTSLLLPAAFGTTVPHY